MTQPLGLAVSSKPSDNTGVPSCGAVHANSAFPSSVTRTDKPDVMWNEEVQPYGYAGVKHLCERLLEV